MEKQTEKIHISVTTTISEKIDEKLTPIMEENKILRSKIETLEEKVISLERENKKNNLILFGLEEKEKDQNELFENVKEKIKNDLHITIENAEINKMHRIGKKATSASGKTRPILMSFVNQWKKTEIVKNKKEFRDVYVAEDYPKAILNKRKELQAQLEEERKKGNKVYIKYDKIVIEEANQTKENRKRMPSTSPIQTNKHAWNPTKTNRTNAFDLMRNRSNSFSSTPSSSAENRE